jgi:hypothetical protein
MGEKVKEKGHQRDTLRWPFSIHQAQLYLKQDAGFIDFQVFWAL